MEEPPATGESFTPWDAPEWQVRYDYYDWRTAPLRVELTAAAKQKQAR